MKSDDNQTQSQDTAAAAAPARLVSPTRRRLLRGGVVGVPAMLALKSTPVMATTANCRLPSGFSSSGNLSQNKGRSCAPPCYTPTTWKGRCNQTTGIYTGTTCKKSHNFSLYFKCGTGTPYSDKVLDTCLGYGDAEDRAMATACYLQACTDGGSLFPTTTTIKDIWNMGVIGGSYPIPGGNTAWDKTACLKYFRYLTGQSA